MQAATVTETLRELGHQLARQLEARGEGGRCFDAAFYRADGQMRIIRIRTSMPTRDEILLTRLFSERLETLADPLDPGFGFDLIQLAARRSEALETEQTVLDGRAVEETDTTVIVDRLGARLGEDHVLRFASEDSHDPARAAFVVPAIAARRHAAWGVSDADEPPLKPVTLFDPPQPVDVVLAFDPPDGAPLQFTWRRTAYRLKRAEGPERIAFEWWRHLDNPPKADEAPPSHLTEIEKAEVDARRQAEAAAAIRPRDYFRFEDLKGNRFWLFRQGLQGSAQNPPRWFLHGLFP